MKKIGWLLALWAPLGLAAQGQSPSTGSLALTHANVIDGLGHAVLRSQTVLVRDGRIEAVGGDIAIPAEATVIDLKGKYLLPGLIDAHVHIWSQAQVSKALSSGITTIRSMGTSNYADVGLRELAKKRVIDSPEVLAAGYHVTPHPAEALFLNEPALADLMSGVRGQAGFRRIAATNIRHGVDWIKTAATERAGLPDTDPRKQTMSEQELSAVVAEASQAGIPVAAHAHGDEGGAAAVRAGVRSIEHGTYLSESTLKLMREKGTFLVPTVAVVTDLVSPGGDYDEPVLQVRGRHMLPRLREVVRKAHQMGIKVVAATDTTFLSESTLTLQHDIEELTRCGLSNLEAIQAATSMAAELLGIEDRTGAVEAGREADLIVVDRNPLKDILSLQDVLLVVNNGKVVLNRLSFALDWTDEPHG